MADAISAEGAAEDLEQAQPIEPPPPSLDTIRIKPRTSRGLNRPAILAISGGGVALVLVLASNGLAANSAKEPAQVKQAMSDPALPQMAQGSLNRLPSAYDRIAASKPVTPPGVPVLGPPLPGDIAAFAPSRTASPPSSTGDAANTSQTSASPNIPARSEADLARRSGLFFQIREPTKTPTAPAPNLSPLTVLGETPGLADAKAGPTDRALFPGAIISASLVTAIDSETPGPAIAQVTQAVYDSATGKTLLIPQGARLIGDYKSAAKFGQSRLAILWSRLILPDGREIALDLPMLDPAGSAGAPGHVDAHWADVFGAAALGTLINMGVAATEQQPTLTATGAGLLANESPMAAAAQQGVERTASAVSDRVVDRSLATPPTIRVPAGVRISVIVVKRTEF